jgi:single-strand DNA-binding protein
MASLNRVLLIGNVGSEPEMRMTGTGRAVCHFSVATNESWKDKDGTKKESTEWHRVTCWGPTAESVSKFLTKGRQVYVEGKIQTRSYEKNGEKKFATDIIAERVLFLGEKSNENSRGRLGNVGVANSTGGNDDDLPF